MGRFLAAVCGNISKVEHTIGQMPWEIRKGGITHPSSTDQDAAKLEIKSNRNHRYHTFTCRMDNTLVKGQWYGWRNSGGN